MRFIVLFAAPLLAGCVSPADEYMARIQYAHEEYAETAQETVEVSGHLISIRQHPAESRLAVVDLSAPERGYDVGLEPRMDAGVKKYLDESCEITSMRMIWHPTYEYEYTCD